jgi:asparagine synthase (glutamine-hydrolysing)
MCGILGLTGHARRDQSKLKQAMALIANRGPDHQEDCLIGNNTWFGHTRLSIIDLSADGNQPFQFQNLTLAFNGMIYNYKQLRDELRQQGYEFNSTSDTEVLIKAWHRWGLKTLAKLDGFFAFAIYDANAQRLFLCRDHLGKKPLYWRHWDDGIAFASRLDAVEAITQKQPLNKQAIPWLFYLKYIPAPLSAAQDIFKLDRGHYLEHDKNGTTIKKWSTTFGLDDDAVRPEAATPETLKQQIITAVKKRLEADVPISCLLSGGLDSSIVASIAARDINLDTFTLAVTGGSNDLQFNEAEIAAKTAAILGTNHHTITLTEDDALASMMGLFSRVFDEPFADPASVLNHLIFKHLSEQSKLCLTGDGADELFGGYRRHQGYLMAHHPLANNPIIRSMASLIAPMLPDRRDHGALEKIRLLRRYLMSLNDMTHDGRSWLCRHDITPDLFIGGGDHVNDFLAWPHHGTTSMDPINALLSIEMQWTIPGQMMVKTDRTSMDVGVESRAPFLDRNVIETAFALHGQTKLKRGQGKAILRDLFCDDVPSHVFNERKRGFEMPLKTWLHGPFQPYLDGVMDEAFLDEIALHPDTPKNWLSSLYHHGATTAADHLWTLIGLKAWLDAR